MEIMMQPQIQAYQLQEGPELQAQQEQQRWQQQQCSAAADAAEAIPGGAVFLHRLVPGHSTPTFGLHCAQASMKYVLENLELNL